MTAKYEDFARKYLNVHNQSGSEWMVLCPYHDNKNSASLQFNVDKGLFICFSCGAKGSFTSLAKHMGIKFTDPGVDVNDLIARLNTLRSQDDKAELELTTLPEEHLSRYRFPTDYWGPCPEKRRPRGCKGRIGCKHHRWLTPETIAAFDLGYDPLDNVAIIPVRKASGGLVGVIRRFLDDDVEFRYKYPKGFKRQNALFGSWLAETDSSDVAVLVEGSVDAICIWQAGAMGFAQYGSSINRRQVRLLLRLGIQEVIFAYDNDKAGRKALRQAQGFTEHLNGGKKVEEYDKFTDLTRHFACKEFDWDPSDSDPGSTSTEDLKWLVENARPLI